MNNTFSSPWLTLYKAKPEVTHRLLCFPYAGAGGIAYRPLVQKAPPWLEVCALEPPGRWSRLREPAFKSLPPYIDQAFAELEPLFDKPVSLFGYSLGALAAFEFAHAMRTRRSLEPTHLFVAARRAPSLFPVAIHPKLSHLPDNDLIKDMVSRYPGMPKEVLDNPDILRLVMPVLRADLEVLETYRYTQRAPLNCPITVWGGSGDPSTPLPDLQPWGQESLKHTNVIAVEGGHFFINQHFESMLATMLKHIQL